MSNPKIPPPNKAAEKNIRRLLCADYLETIATLIRKGAVTGFEFVWDEEMPKPAGSLEVVSDFLSTPLEIKLTEQAEAAKKAEAAKTKIELFDISDDVKKHEKCENPRCIACARDPEPS